MEVANQCLATSISSLFHAQPATQLTPRWTLTVHKDAYAVDLCREPRGEDKRGVEYHYRGDYLPRRDAKRYAGNHNNGRGEWYHRGPECY